MTKDRLAHAVRRLDQALVRVEAASQRASSAPSAGFVQLQQRHERLRAKTQDAIGALDRLIGA